MLTGMAWTCGGRSRQRGSLPHSTYPVWWKGWGRCQGNVGEKLRIPKIQRTAEGGWDLQVFQSRSWSLRSAWETLGRAELPEQPRKCRVSGHSSLAAVICFIRSFAFNVAPASPNAFVSVSAAAGCGDVCLVELFVASERGKRKRWIKGI